MPLAHLYIFMAVYFCNANLIKEQWSIEQGHELRYTIPDHLLEAEYFWEVFPNFSNVLFYEEVSFQILCELKEGWSNPDVYGDIIPDPGSESQSFMFFSDVLACSLVQACHVAGLGPGWNTAILHARFLSCFPFYTLTYDTHLLVWLCRIWFLEATFAYISTS